MVPTSLGRALTAATRQHAAHRPSLPKRIAPSFAGSAPDMSCAMVPFFTPTWQLSATDKQLTHRASAATDGGAAKRTAKWRARGKSSVMSQYVYVWRMEYVLHDGAAGCLEIGPWQKHKRLANGRAGSKDNPAASQHAHFGVRIPAILRRFILFNFWVRRRILPQHRQTVQNGLFASCVQALIRFVSALV